MKKTSMLTLTALAVMLVCSLYACTKTIEAPNAPVRGNGTVTANGIIGGGK